MSVGPMAGREADAKDRKKELKLAGETVGRMVVMTACETVAPKERSRVDWTAGR